MGNSPSVLASSPCRLMLRTPYLQMPRCLCCDVNVHQCFSRVHALQGCIIKSMFVQ